MKKSIVVLLCVAFIAALLAACGGAAPAAEEAAPAATEEAAAEAAAPEATEETAPEEVAEPLPTSVTVAITYPPATFDPIGQANVGVNPFATTQLNCALYGRDAEGNVVNELVVSEERSEDGMAVIAKVRTDVKFQNGDPVTVDDIVFSYNTYIASPSGAIMLNYVGPVMTKIDEETVSIPINYPNVDYKGIVQFAKIVPQALYESDPAAFGSNPVGCGPYKFVSFTNNELVEMAAFDGYFLGVAPIPTIYVKVITDPSTAAIALEAGEIDVLFNAPAIELDRLAANPELAVAKKLSNGVISLGMMRGEAMDNPKLREAIFHAVNPEDALIAARNGDGALPTDLTPIDNIGVLAGIVDYSNTYDPELAQQLLAESGFDTATPITLSLCVGYFPLDAGPAGISIANNLQAIGLNVVTETLDGTVCTDKWLSGNIEMMINQQGTPPMLITDTLNWYTTTGDFFNMNNGTAKTPELDAAVNALRFALTEEDYIAAGTTALQLFYETYQLLPLYIPNTNVVYNAALKNMVADATGYGYVSAFYWSY